MRMWHYRDSENKRRGLMFAICQPQVPLRLPCFDFRTVDCYYSKRTFIVRNFIIDILPSHDEQLVHLRDDIHRVVMIHDYSEFLLHVGEFQPTIRTLTYFDDLLILSISHHFVLRSCGTSITHPIRAMRACHSP